MGRFGLRAVRRACGLRAHVLDCMSNQRNLLRSNLEPGAKYGAAYAGAFSQTRHHGPQMLGPVVVNKTDRLHHGPGQFPPPHCATA
jgi:hypothetical protein